MLGADLSALADDATVALRQRWGVMFQHGGLFGALTVNENVGLPLREHTELDDALIDEIAMAKLAMTGLTAEVGAQYPSELSGGMLKRASLARALALDPELLFLDEPTAGLDPVSAEGVDDLVLKLRDLFGLTVFMITHDLGLLWQVADRVAVLADGKVQGVGSMTEESVAGLNLNAPVKYNGVEVGKVSDIRLDPVNPEKVRLTFAIEHGTPIKADTVAVLKDAGADRHRLRRTQRVHARCTAAAGERAGAVPGDPHQAIP